MAQPPWPTKLKVIGLTGGIACGKSVVAKIFVELGAPLIDADVLAREVVAPGTEGLQAIAARFPGVVSADGDLDRKALAKRVFSSAEDRASINAIVHPLVNRAAVLRAEQLAQEGAPIALYDVPLLFENGLEAQLDGTVVVSAPREAQISRLIARNDLSREEAEARIAAQWPLEEKLRRATWVIDNGGTLESTREQVERVWRGIRAER